MSATDQFVSTKTTAEWTNFALKQATGLYATACGGITRVGTTTANNGNSGATTIIINKPVYTSDLGNFMIAAVTVRLAATTITAPAGWTQVPNLNHATGNIHQMVFYKIPSGTESSSYTFGLAGSTPKASAVLAAFTGVDPLAPFVGTPAGTTSSTASFSAPPVTVGANDGDSYLLSIFGNAHDAAFTWQAGRSYYVLGEDASSGGATNTRTRTGFSGEFVPAGSNTPARSVTAATAANNVGQSVVLRRISARGADACSGIAIGAACTGGGLYAGVFKGERLMILPGACDGTTNNPTCNNSDDVVSWIWYGSTGVAGDIADVENVALAASASTQLGNFATLQIVASTIVSSDSAGDYCDQVIYGGFSDWYLPSKSEMAYIYCKALVNGGAHNTSFPEENVNCVSFGGKTSEIGGFVNANYWTSTELNSTNAWRQSFTTGTQTTTSAKSTPLRVRCLRKF